MTTSSASGAWTEATMPGDRATYQIAQVITLMSSCADEATALDVAVAYLTDTLEATAAAAIIDGTVRASLGDVDGEHPFVATATMGTSPEGQLVVARATPLEGDERELLDAVGLVVGQSLRMLRSLAEERSLVALLTERQRLLERLGRIQRSISHRAPLQEVLDAITLGVRDLLGDPVCGLRLIDPEHPDEFELASYCGLNDDEIAQARRGPVGQGAGGRAIAEDRLVIIEDYASQPNTVPVFKANAMTTAMAAPVHENGRVVGSLVTASYTPGRHYSKLEQEALCSLAQHASLALTDAKTVEAMREAQRAKDMFLAMVSHELKTPLTVIMGTLRTLQRNDVDPDLAREMVAAAYGRGDELRRLIDRLLRGARAELAGARRDASLRDLVDGAVDGFAQLRRLTVDSEDAEMLVDTVAFADVIGILVENAVAHAPADAPVRVAARPTGQDVVVAVTNPGELGTDIDARTLFQPFHRGAGARSSGVGLGLYIAARLAESMGGGIEVMSEAGEVTFALRVPRYPVSVVPPPAPALSTPA